MTDPRRICFVVAVLLLGSCDNFYLLRGSLHGDCDPPRVTMNDAGTASSTLRQSNCQVTNTVCCRVNATTTRASCEYPEDCYTAPYRGPCATAVDCADTQTCSATDQKCECLLGGPTCANPLTGVISCCGVGATCDTTMGMCSDSTTIGLDGGTTPEADGGFGF